MEEVNLGRNDEYQELGKLLSILTILVLSWQLIMSAYCA